MTLPIARVADEKKPVDDGGESLAKPHE